jgi:hypothetical protein
LIARQVPQEMGREPDLCNENSIARGKFSNPDSHPEAR